MVKLEKVFEVLEIIGFRRTLETLLKLTLLTAHILRFFGKD